MRYNISYSCVSHIGKVRSINQDNFICAGRYISDGKGDIRFPLKGNASSSSPVLFGIFDGMGGEECGEIASFIAAKTACEFPLTKNGVADMSVLCRDANAAICEYTEKNRLNSMGTTAAMLLFSKKDIILCNIGDSKIIRFSDGGASQISQDHVCASAFGTKPPLSQNLGIPEDEMTIEPYISKGTYKTGDRYLICSDGLTDMVSPEDILNIVNSNDINTACKRLLVAALDAGGKDNTTIMMFEVQKKSLFGR
ncbi:MAG: serine/threonine-protein phosphatase [Clostridia bacterium]|nr:serine/threonine-protein phosphatase [Clostridia bacterium]